MKQKWFWGTFAFWVIFAGTVMAWALIYSPVHFAPKFLSQYETEINGLKQKNELWVNEGHLTALLPVITQNWLKDGWRPAGNNLDLTSAILGALDENTDLSDQVQVRVFQKKDFHKTLGLWEPTGENQTYGWVSEIPDKALNPSTAKSNWHFPFIPPENSNRLYCQKLKNLQIALITLPADTRFEDHFHESCINQGFTQNLWRNDPDKKSYILSKGKTRLLAVLTAEGNQDSISLAYFLR